MRISGLLQACLLGTALIITGCGAETSLAPQANTIVPSIPVASTKKESGPITQEALDTELTTQAEAARFLMMAGFGADEATQRAWTSRNAGDWVAAQMAMPATLSLPELQARYPEYNKTKRYHSDLLLETFITAEDELRQRMVMALSEIFVISDRNFFGRGYETASFTDALATHAFGNYRDLLEDVTFSSAMANYLTYYKNEKGNLATGRMPDENYAREVLQLFSIGLVELNMDGTVKLGPDGEPIETYTNDDIIGLARVFTGFSRNENRWWGNDDDSSRWTRLKIFNEYHSPLEKRFLGTRVTEFTQGEPTVAQALDAIAEHPNVAPFMARQLIQRFTASNPSPDYVERVAIAFETGSFSAEGGQVFGTGKRGDMGATIAAVLLDHTQHNWSVTETSGKVREPVLKFVHALRAFNAAPVNIAGDYRLTDMSNPSDRLGQHILRAPSVFNFFRPGFIAPGTLSGEAGMTAPELQIVNEGAALGYIDYMGHYLVEKVIRPPDEPRLAPDYSKELALAETPAALVDHLDLLLTGGTMAATTKADIIDTVSTIEWPADGDTAEIALARTSLAVLMSVTSGAYEVLD